MLKLLIGLSLAVSSAWGACDVCNTENPVACHSERKYSLCINGNPLHNYVYCPLGYVCTNEKRICIAKSVAVDRGCPNIDARNRCGICSAGNRVFSCLNETTIAFCFGNDTPDLEALAYCPQNTICDLENVKDFCSYVDKAEPSCRETTIDDNGQLTTTLDTTTVDPPTTILNPTLSNDPLVYCRNIQQTGSYKPNGDTECKQFIYCYWNGEIWTGLYRDCPADKYFSNSLGFCTDQKPDYCD